MNNDKWNSLGPELQKTVQDLTEKYFDQVGMGLWDKQNEAAMNGAIKQNNMEIITLPQPEADRWINLVAPVQQDYVERMTKLGFKGADILKLVQAKADQYNQEFK